MSRPGAVALSPEEAQRLARVDALCSAGGDPVPPLVAMLDDTSWAVRRGVVSALASLGDAGVGPLCEVLRTHRDDEARIAAAVDALAASTGGTADERVAELVYDPNPAVISDAAQILGRRRASASIALTATLSSGWRDSSTRSGTAPLARRRPRICAASEMTAGLGS